MHVHAINETADSLRGEVEILLHKGGHIVAARQSVPCELAPRSQRTLSADEILGAFYDVTYAYRFGPPKHDVVIATLFDQEHKPISEAFHFVQPRDPGLLNEGRLEVNATVDDEVRMVSLKSDRFLQGVNLRTDGYLPDDIYYHLPPDRERVVRFRMLQNAARFHGYVEALNLKMPLRFATK